MTGPRIKARTYLVAAFVVFSFTMMAQSKGTLKGTLSDPSGAAVANSVIEIRWNAIGASHQPAIRHKKTTSTTDTAGAFVIELAPGDYDVFAYRDGFAPTCGVVSISAGETAKLVLRFPGFAPQSLMKRVK
jgi:hypothetical protein